MSTIKEEKSLYNPQERKQSHHLELLNKLTAESHMSSKQKKVIEIFKTNNSFLNIFF